MKKALLILFIGIVGNVFAQHPCTPPVININGSSWKCKGAPDTLTVSGPNGTTYAWDNGQTTTSIITYVNSNSTFYVVATNGGCSDTGYFKVTLRLPPAVTANSPASFCAGQPITLTASAIGSNPPFSYTWSTGQTGSSITINPGPVSTTTYTVFVSNGCSSAATTTAIPNVPNMFVCCNNTIVTGHDTMLIASSGSGMVKYQWSPSVTCLNPPLCDSVEVAPVVSTVYTVTGLDSLGCSAEREVTIFVGAAGIPSISGAGFVNVYPNPSSVEFTVNLQNKALLQVSDITGRVLFSEMENPGIVKFGEELTPGMYILFVDGKPATKLVKQ